MRGSSSIILHDYRCNYWGEIGEAENNLNRKARQENKKESSDSWRALRSHLH